MLEILSLTSVIFILIATGYLAVRSGKFTAGEMATLGKFVVAFAIPALIFRALSSRPLGEIFDAGYIGAMLGGSLLVFAFGYVWARRVGGASAEASTFSAVGMSCSNSGFVGYPLLLMALPQVAQTALALNMVVENLVMIPLALVMAERAQGGGATSGARLAGQIALRLLRNPIIIALILGMIVSVAGLRMPAVIARPIDIMASASAALSLTAIGGALAGLPLRSINASVLSVVIGKLLLHPLAVGAGLVVMSATGFGVQDDNLAAAAIIMASMPVMSIYPILAQRYGEGQNAALALLVMTAASFVTITLVLAIMLP
ncbi:AEC family transporter [Paracoccus aurantiacus]|uniref:AEC family transporter n=1 Tax=Paracoccus aurantiacus TaxID=2599412 RepID=A0A5C6S0D9_9RHOB|nr:AEC family transporter [Paracoccus aurantiacus]TXB67864.1 AEC family transporter [Paracoccus aurantiacus]